MTRRLLPVLAALALALAAPAARAQEQPSTRGPEPRITPNDEAHLRQSNREFLHQGGDPLEIVGHEQEDNDLRGGTPALQRFGGAATLVDTEELYRRKLALYDRRARFTSGLTPVDVNGVDLASARRYGSPAAHGVAAAAQEESAGPGWIQVTLALTAVLTGVGMFLLVPRWFARQTAPLR